MAQGNSTAVWSEQLPAGAAVAIAEAGYRDDSGDWEPVLVTPAFPTKARVLDFGDGFTLVDVANPFVLVDDGAGGLELDSSGIVAGHLVDDGAGGLEASTDLTLPTAGAFYADASGDVYAVRSDAPELLLMKLGDDFITYL